MILKGFGRESALGIVVGVGGGACAKNGMGAGKREWGRIGRLPCGMDGIVCVWIRFAGEFGSKLLISAPFQFIVGALSLLLCRRCLFCLLCIEGWGGGSVAFSSSS